MHIVFRNRVRRPLLSVVLADWSVRESVHSIDYLNRQSVPRDCYELLWIEYYAGRPAAIASRLERSHAEGRPPALDAWITLDVPTNTYYHKHLIYNVGILASAGRVVVFCDSDAIFRPTFVEAILEAFEREPKLVLHLDEVRSANRSHYPFDYPTIEQIEKEQCINLIDGRPAGVPGPDGQPVEDQLHVANYGACMAARRDDLVAIGGADEHIDFLGHICGPYEMTFRLRNYGRLERWHEAEWLYHVWHPGQAGEANYLGPHDGRHMSTTALGCLWSGRIRPLVENAGVRALREARSGAVVWELPIAQAVPYGDLPLWSVAALPPAEKTRTHETTAIANYASDVLSEYWRFASGRSGARRGRARPGAAFPGSGFSRLRPMSWHGRFK